MCENEIDLISSLLIAVVGGVEAEGENLYIFAVIVLQHRQNVLATIITPNQAN